MTEPAHRRSAASLLPPGALDHLRVRYADPPRRYHTLGHAAAVAALVVELGGSRAAVLAAWFHDAVYVPGASDNEARSARLLREWLPDDPDAPAAAALVLATASHVPPAGDADAAVLCDADLAVLGRTPGAYATYVRAVREEHAHLDPAAWRSGRAAVLQHLLARDPLFHTAEGRRRWSDVARRNLAAELQALTGG